MGRVMDRMLDNFLENYCVVSDKALRELDDGDDNDKDDELNIIFDEVHVNSVAEFIFSLGSDPATNDKYRKSLYDMYKKYKRRLKQIGKDVKLSVDDADEDSP